jgi:hypothetical protein
MLQAKRESHSRASVCKWLTQQVLHFQVPPIQRREAMFIFDRGLAKMIFNFYTPANMNKLDLMMVYFTHSNTRHYKLNLLNINFLLQKLATPTSTS